MSTYFLESQVAFCASPYHYSQDQHPFPLIVRPCDVWYGQNLMSLGLTGLSLVGGGDDFFPANLKKLGT